MSLIKKTPVAVITRGSVGRFKSSPSVGKKSLKGIDNGVKKTMISNTLSSEMNKKRNTAKANGNNPNR